MGDTVTLGTVGMPAQRSWMACGMRKTRAPLRSLEPHDARRKLWRDTSTKMCALAADELRAHRNGDEREPVTGSWSTNHARFPSMTVADIAPI